MTITLPDEMREELERKAKAAGLESVDAYIVWLCKLEDTGSADLTAEDLGFGSHQELEAKLLASLASGPPILATPEFWAELRKTGAAQGEGKS
jgi:hypothetical protein